MLVQQGNGFDGSTETDQIVVLRSIFVMMTMIVIVFMIVITAIIVILLLPMRVP